MKYLLNFIGERIYTVESFIAEAKKLGVNRGMPLKQIKTMKFGDKILLATFDQKLGQTEQQLSFEGFEAEQKKFDGRKNKKDGTAKVFGYFTVSGLNLRASDAFKEELTKQLDVVESKDNNALYQRGCGSYLLGTSYIITNTLEEVVSKIEKLMLERNESVKVFITGAFTELNAEISPINYSRSVIAVDIVEEIPFEEVINVIGYIYNYEKRLYIKKYDKPGRPWHKQKEK